MDTVWIGMVFAFSAFVGRDPFLRGTMKKMQGIFASGAAVLLAGGLFIGSAFAGGNPDNFAKAIFKGNVATVKKMLSDGFNPKMAIPWEAPTAINVSGKRPALYVAAAWGNAKIVQLIMNAGGKPKIAICVAAKYGWPKITKMLLEGGYDASTKCKSKPPRTMLEMAKRGADGKNPDGEPLQGQKRREDANVPGVNYGSKADFAETVKLLMAAGAK